MRVLRALSFSLLLPLFVAAPAVAQPVLRTLGPVYTHTGTLTMAALHHPNGQRQLVLLSGAREVYRLSTRFSANTSLSTVHYGSNGGAEWLSFRAEDPRYQTAYTWYFRTGRLAYEAYNKRTGRTTRRS